MDVIMFSFWLKSDNISVETSSYLFYDVVLNTSYVIKDWHHRPL